MVYKDSIVRFSIGIEDPDDESMYFVRLLSKKEGVLTGSSSGAAVAGAIKQAYKAKWKLNYGCSQIWL